MWLTRNSSASSRASLPLSSVPYLRNARHALLPLRCLPYPRQRSRCRLHWLEQAGDPHPGLCFDRSLLPHPAYAFLPPLPPSLAYLIQNFRSEGHSPVQRSCVRPRPLPPLDDHERLQHARDRPRARWPQRRAGFLDLCRYFGNLVLRGESSPFLSSFSSLTCLRSSPETPTPSLAMSTSCVSSPLLPSSTNPLYSISGPHGPPLERLALGRPQLDHGPPPHLCQRPPAPSAHRRRRRSVPLSRSQIFRQKLKLVVLSDEPGQGRPRTRSVDASSHGFPLPLHSQLGSGQVRLCVSPRLLKESLADSLLSKQTSSPSRRPSTRLSTASLSTASSSPPPTSAVRAESKPCPVSTLDHSYPPVNATSERRKRPSTRAPERDLAPSHPIPTKQIACTPNSKRCTARNLLQPNLPTLSLKAQALTERTYSASCTACRTACTPRSWP